MGRFYCNCLNVIITGHSVPSGRERLPDQLNNKRIIPIILDLTTGLVYRHPLLVKTTSIDSNWSIAHCTNCSTDLYVTSSNEQKDKLYIFNHLKTDPSTIKNHSDFSPVFNIILKENKTQSGHSGSFDESVTRTISAQTESFISEEEQKMEQAIREYEKAQREEFKKLKERAYEDKRRLILSLDQAKVTVTESDEVDKPPITEHSSQRKEVTSVTIPLKQEILKSSRNTTDTSNDTDLFDFDEDMTEEVVPSSEASPFPFSSDDETTDSSSSNEGSLTNNMEERYRLKNIPSSLPLSMPFLSNKSSQMLPMRQSPPAVDFAQSIQQLALSVQDTGMFGDLPKPRTRLKNSLR